MIGPVAAASPPTAPQMPSAAARFSTGNSGRTSASEAGVRIAPPIACMTRASTKRAAVGASPQSIEPTLKSASPRIKDFFRPKTSAKRPAVRSAAA